MTKERLEIKPDFDEVMPKKAIKTITDSLDNIIPRIDLPPKRVAYMKNKIIEDINWVIEEYFSSEFTHPLSEKVSTSYLSRELKMLATYRRKYGEMEVANELLWLSIQLKSIEGEKYRTKRQKKIRIK